MALADFFNNIGSRFSGSSSYSSTTPSGGGGTGYRSRFAGGIPDYLMNPVSGTTQVSRSLQEFLNPNSSYIQNARQRGIEQAATRGGVNSSIAAGASERAAMEAALPLVNQAVDVDQQRYQFLAQDYLADQGYAAESQIQSMLAAQRAQQENWLSEQNFGRALFGQTFTNSMGMLNMIQQYALEDPELYTPEVASGYTNFFQQNMNDLLSRYFGG